MENSSKERKELEIKDFVTNEFAGIENVNKTIEALHGGECLRAVLNINETPKELTEKAQPFT